MVEELIILCKSGDRKAQRELFEKFSGKLFRLCYRYLQHQMDAEDMLVNGFVKIYQNLHTLEFKNKEATEGWMKKIMVNECLMHLRKKRALSYIPEEANEDKENEPVAIPADDLEVEEIYAQILKLPPGYRTVFNLYILEGYTHKEISTQLGISENTSKSQLHKARTMLQELLVKEGISYDK